MDLKLLSLYVGPDQVMPVASILATVMGLLLVFWGKLLGIIRKIFHMAPPPPLEQQKNPPDSSHRDETPKTN